MRHRDNESSKLFVYCYMIKSLSQM